MAKKPATTQPQHQPEPIPEEPAVKSFTVGKFSFTPDKGLTIPANLPKAQYANESPLKRLFEMMEHQDHMFIPRSFFVSDPEAGGRGMAPEKATASVMRAKVRDTFNSWRKRTAPAHDSKRIVLTPRQEGQLKEHNNPKAGKWPEDGVSFWILDSTQER